MRRFGRRARAAGVEPEQERVVGLEAQVCSLVVGYLSPSECQKPAPGLPYRTTCPT